MQDGGFTSIVFRTTDSGVNWKPSLRLANVSDIVFAPGGSRVAYVLGDQANTSYSGTTQNHLFRTVDGGDHWQAFPGRVLGPRTRAGLGGRYDGHQITSLLVDPSATNIVYGETLGGRFARSLDRGATWTFVATPPDAHTNKHP
jgi:photosystem II stability/assembly factor-like uncharacterized protein